jgi:hyperosmotically inducible protein
MIRKASLKLVPGLLLGLTLAGPAFAQTAGQSMNEAGHSGGSAASNAWQSTKTAVRDTDITAKVKMALHNDKLTKDENIHVKTVDGVVTLRGHAPSTAADRAERLARDTTGVVGVNNKVKVTDSGSMSAR